MAGGLTVSVRQIASYPLVVPGLGDLILMQQGGLGGPYATADVTQIVARALAQGPSLGVGVVPPADATGNQLFSVNTAIVNDGARYWNAYTSTTATWRYWTSGAAGADGFDGVVGFDWQIAPVGQADAAIPATSWATIMQLTPAGSLRLPFGTLTVARDPTGALDVATMGWVGRSTVASFNGRRGTITLSAADIYAALGICPPDQLATTASVNAQICAAINDLIRTYPGVWSWMGRVGDVFLNVADMNFATLGLPPGLPPLQVLTPPADSNDLTVPNTQWIVSYVTQTAGFATESWVLSQLSSALAQTVHSFNGRFGAVTLGLADVTGAGGAPLASPDFSGIPTGPTANPGTATAQLATTAFVVNTLTALTPGVISFNGRGGTVTLDATDINNAGGALLNSPNLTGTPAAPTAPAGTSTSQIATTAFVMAEVAATTAGVATFNGRTGNVTLVAADVSAVGGLVNPDVALTGIPTAPTAANGTSTQQVATTAFVLNEIAAINAGVLTFNSRSGTVTLTANDVTAVGGLTNPSVALTGTPSAPTPAPTDNSTNIATTAFVKAALANTTGGAVVQNTPPVSPTPGMLWFSTGDAQTYVWNGSTWVIAVNPPLGNYAPLSGANFTGPISATGASVNGPLTVSGATTLAAPTSIAGVSNGSSAAAGMVGEVITLGPTPAAGFTAGAFVNALTMSLPAGAWLVSGMIILSSSSVFTCNIAQVLIPPGGNTASGTDPLAGGRESTQYYGTVQGSLVGPLYWNSAAAFSVNLQFQVNNFTGAGANYSAWISALRIR